MHLGFEIAFLATSFFGSCLSRSTGSPLCNITLTQMTTFMTGSNRSLNFGLAKQEISNGIQVTVGNPNPATYKGLLLWTNIGSFAAPPTDSGFRYVNFTKCPASVTHANAVLKTNPANFVWIPPPTTSNYTVEFRAVVVYNRTNWQFLDPLVTNFTIPTVVNQPQPQPTPTPSPSAGISISPSYAKMLMCILFVVAINGI
ncbi:hypothetical protein O9G_005600 [Rozella allomycis CSF55]|uniref:Reelin domain-containing protein n=1 Tax=Rozella allomycis (strain CSF55) TaxID=988480 RepID=A0A075B3R6_ROZAC|nr:hypothetical protein O9G_005600 [Rozella allomycis CSF55]|eukprot:EPZ35691.1 hypothetical protein O9G_005600 [Rozella allomycis CSF55]